MNKAKYLIVKYQNYVSNLEWHIDTNKPQGEQLAITKKQIECYREIVADLQKAFPQINY